jgi:hypothetical protein
MKKLKLALDDLEVETFRTGPAFDNAGTVLGKAVVPGTGESDQVLCGQTQQSCYDTCDFSCAAGCVTAQEECANSAVNRTCWGRYTCIEYSHCDPTCDCV